MSEKMREEFEAWVLSEYPNQSLGRFKQHHGGPEGEYQGFTVQHCWLAWQASRAAVVVDLPEHYQYDSPGEVIPVLKDCREAIEAALGKAVQL